MTNTGKGLEAFHAAGNKLKAEVKATSDMVNKAIVGAQLSPEALAFMNENVQVGAEELNTGVAVPQLRIHSVGVSTKNQLANGSEPADGDIFYTGTQEAFPVVRVVILSIRKCRLEQTSELTGEKSMKATYLVAGLIEQSGDLFVMYVKGMSYNKIWDLEEQLKPYVTKRAGGIPLLMLKIDVSSEKERVEQGKYKGQMKNVFHFELAKDPSGEFPVLESDVRRLQHFKEMIVRAEEMLDALIAQKGMTEKQYKSQNAGVTEIDGDEIEVIEVPAPSDLEVPENIIDADDPNNPPF